jgi:hypothetical protein
VPDYVNLIHPQHPPRGRSRDVVPGGSVSERRLDHFPGGVITAARREPHRPVTRKS